MSDIERIILLDAEEKTAPPSESVLSLSSVDDRVFIEIGEYDETHDTTIIVAKATVSIKWKTLIDAIVYLWDSRGTV